MHKASRVLQYEGFLGFWRRLQQKLSKPKRLKGNYQAWIRRYDTLNDQQRSQIGNRIQGLPHTPVISLIMAVQLDSWPNLTPSIDSLQRQLYPHWELCLAVYGATPGEWLDQAISDHRICIIHCPAEEDAAGAKNFAFGQITGNFAVFLDAGDELADHALYHIVEAIHQHPNAGLIYSDEDQINQAGKRLNPHFKCEFNYELLLASDILTHLTVYPRALLQQLSGLKTEYATAAEYDLALRAIECLDPDQIIHIPHILYHQRVPRYPKKLGLNSFAMGMERQAVQDHLRRCAIDAEVVPAPESPTHRRVRFRLSAPLPLVSIIIPTRDRADLLATCINSILTRTSYPNFEVLIIDNGSVEPKTKDLFQQLPKDRLHILRDERPFNYSALNNCGVQATKGEIICLMNNDIEILTADWLEEMVGFAHRPDVGCVGARLWFPSGLLQHGGVITGIGAVAGHAHANLPRGAQGYFHRAVLHQSFSAVTAACLVVRRSVFNQVGGLDESLAVAFNDVDFCLRVQAAGYRNVWTPYAEMIHYESASRGLETTPVKQARFEQEVALIHNRWGQKLYQDPAYNPNLSLEDHTFAFAFPPRVPYLS
jgi:GT2 family glycosyltransferase